MSLSEQIEELEDRIEKLEDENSDLESEVDDLLEEKEGLEEDLREIKEKFQKLESQVAKGKDYTIFVRVTDGHHTFLKDSKNNSILCLDSLDELGDKYDTESGIRLFNTELYKWVEVIDSNAQYQFVLERK